VFSKINYKSDNQNLAKYSPNLQSARMMVTYQPDADAINIHIKNQLFLVVLVLLCRVSFAYL